MRTLDEVPSRDDNLREQRRALPDSPGVYIFKDASGRALYVGKAKSIRKRVASHFSHRSRMAEEFLERVESIDFVATANEAEALLAEQNFIKRYRPPFNIRLRDDKSYPYIGISLEEPYPRVYFTRERHRHDRVYFGPFSSAKRVRETLDLLGGSSRTAPARGRNRAARPAARASTTSSSAARRPASATSARRPTARTSTRSSASSRAATATWSASSSSGCRRRAGAQEFEQAAVFRNRLRAVRSLFERQRVANEAVGTLDVIGVAVEETHANAQVFQVRDGILADRQSFYLENRAGRSEDEVAEEFAIQYYATSFSIPPEIVGPPSLARAEALKNLLEERRQGPVELRHAQRGDKRRLYELAQRNARLALEQEKLRTQRRREQRVDALNDLREVLELDALPVRIECFDISNLGPSHTVASMVVFEGGAPKKSDYRRFKIRDLNGGQDDFAAMARCSRAAWRGTRTSASAHRTTRRTTPASRRFRA